MVALGSLLGTMMPEDAQDDDTCHEEFGRTPKA